MRDEIRQAADRIYQIVLDPHWKGHAGKIEDISAELEKVDQVAEERGRREMREETVKVAASLNGRGSLLRALEALPDKASR